LIITNKTKTPRRFVPLRGVFSRESMTMTIIEKQGQLKPEASKAASSETTADDFVTVLTVKGRGNKLVTRNDDGSITKEAGPPISEASAQTFRIENCDGLAELLEEIGKTPDRVLILAYTPGTEPAEGMVAGEPYLIVSQKIMGEALGVDPKTAEGRQAVLGRHVINGVTCYCRLKENMARSSWFLLDFDIVKGMPDQLAKMGSGERLEAMTEILPGLNKAGIVIMPSTTGRVLVDGEPMDATGEHFYGQMEDATDLERFGAVLLQRSILTGYGYMRPKYSTKEPDKVTSTVPWGLADPTTFSQERLVYDGSPSVKGEGLEVAKGVVEILDGGRLDTHLLLDLTEDEAARYAEITGQYVSKRREIEKVLGPDGRVVDHQVLRFGAIDDSQLKMDTVIETEVGDMTVEEYWKSDNSKLRCQTPFRDSTSENGILNRHRDGTPFVYDNGIRTRYILSKEIIQKHRADIYLSRLRRLSPEEIRDTWMEGLR
jgi:hypothetical protein